jgi:xanthine dehydrogenase accessory factor
MIESDAVLDKAASLRAAGQPFVLATVVRSESHTSAKPGAKALVEPDGTLHGWVGGGCAQPAVIRTAREVLADGKARLIRISPDRDEAVEQGVTGFAMSCHSGGTLDIFIDPVLPRPALLVIGASPAAQALADLAKRVGFAVTAAYPGADRTLFPDAGEVVAGLDMSSLRGARPAFVVVATQGKRDEGGLEAALATGAGYIAFIASRTKAEKLRRYLKERGHDHARVDAIVSPAGLDIGAVTPEEIALAVLAGLVQARRRGTGVAAVAAVAATQAVSAPEVVSVAHPPGEAVDPVCGMTVEMARAEYTLEYGEQRYYFCCAGCQHSFEQDPGKYLEAAAAPA